MDAYETRRLVLDVADKLMDESARWRKLLADKWDKDRQQEIQAARPSLPLTMPLGFE